MNSRELACGKAAKRTKGFGAQSMTNVEMKKFIQEHGSEKAKFALKSISGVASRGQMCAIFHMFRRGREEIAKGEGQGRLRLTPSPNRRRSPSSSSGSSSSSPNMNIKKTLNIYAFSEGRKKRQLKSVLRAFRPRRNTHLIKKREHGFGPKVLMARPQRRRSSSSSSNRNVNKHYSSGGSRSNRSYASNYGGSNVGNNIMKFANYQNLRAKRNKKVIKAKAPSRFSRRNMFERVKAGTKRRPRTPSSSSSSNNGKRRPLVKKTYPMMVVPSVHRGLGSIPTRAGVPYHRTGTQSPETKRKINEAHAERMRKYATLVRPGMTAAKKSALSNKLLQKAIRNVMGNSNSNANVSPTKRAKNVKARIMKKLRAMERRKLPKVNLAKAFAGGIMSGRQQVNALEARRPTKNERTALNNLRKKYAAMMGGNKSSSSSSNSNSNRRSPPKAVAAKKKATGAMKSIRRP